MEIVNGVPCYSCADVAKAKAGLLTPSGKQALAPPPPPPPLEVRGVNEPLAPRHACQYRDLGRGRSRAAPFEVSAAPPCQTRPHHFAATERRRTGECWRNDVAFRETRPTASR